MRKAAIELAFETGTPFQKPRQRQENPPVFQAFNKQRTLDDSGGVVTLSFQIFRERQDAGIPIIVIPIEHGHNANSCAVTKLQAFIFSSYRLIAEMRQQQNSSRGGAIRSI